MSTTTLASPTIGFSHKRENLVMFVDWANAYRQAIKLHKPELFFTEEQASSGKPEEQSTTSKDAQQKRTLEQLLAEFVRGLKKYDNTNLVTEKGIENLFNLLEHMNENGVQDNMKKLLGYRKKLIVSDGRRQFLEEHRLQSGNKANAKSFYVLGSSRLQAICCQWIQHEPPPHLNHCFIFLSHRPGAEERIKANRIYAKMIKKYKVLFYERIKTSTERKARAEEGKNSEVEVFVREKEKGVDVSIGVTITDIIRKSVEKKEAEKTHIVLVSGDSDFKPVIEYAFENKVSIDVWAWESVISATYKKFLKNAGPTVRLFYLDRYLYQVGFVVKLIFKYEVALEDADESRGNNLSRFMIAERLTRYSNSLKECDEELAQLYVQQDEHRKSEEKNRQVQTEKLNTLKRRVELFPRDESLLSTEQKDVKNKMERLKESLSVHSETSKKIGEISILIKNTKEKKQKLEKEQKRKEQNEEALDCKTSDFRIIKNGRRYTIAFYFEAKRLEFLDYLNNSEEDFAKLLRTFHVKVRDRSEEEFQHEFVYQRNDSISSEQLRHEDAENDDNGDDDSVEIQFQD